MSEKLIKQVWLNFPEGGSRLHLLQAIAEAANDQGNCYPHLCDLATTARMSRSNVWRTLKCLRKDRWVVTSRIQGQGGVLVMQINLPKLNRSVRANADRTSNPTAGFR